MSKKDYISPKDWKFLEQKPYGDPDFSEEHNRRVIAEVDAFNDRMEKEKEKEFKEKTRERVNAVTSYLKNLSSGKGIREIDKYFGKRYLAYLRGEEIVRQLKQNPALLEKIKEKMEKQGKLEPL